MIMVFKKKIRMMKSKVFLTSILVLFLSCSFYSMKGSIPAHIKNISLAPVSNQSAEFSASFLLNQEMNQLMIEKNILDIVRQSDADSYLEIVITSVLDNPLIVSLSNEGLEQVEEWKLTINVNVKWYDIIRDEVLFERTMSSWGSYVPGLDIGQDGIDNDGDNYIDSEDSDESGSARVSALEISIRLLSENIINEIINTW